MVSLVATPAGELRRSASASGKARGSHQSIIPVVPSSGDFPLEGRAAQQRPVTTDLLESARATLQAESRRHQRDPMFAAPEGVTPLARVGAGGATPRVEQLAFGRVRVNAGGREYCLDRPSEVVARDLPQPMLAVPTPC